ncbi:hypothetical protein [Pseudohoeflea coraliihabitans]|uniref:DUF930 domain-containing protein n=1 Tax=Pseudohoeflea coraliihabitans TaxID=2860393 RepID=A0ABS6WSF8_9HYPH|nr:hypothetical protein [Pseudohoeflea sp. DP4N28-3]MBW3098735.1 hypothetical protein [Pseudohoeflea sp. DP4N28-3]
MRTASRVLDRFLGRFLGPLPGLAMLAAGLALAAPLGAPLTPVAQAFTGGNFAACRDPKVLDYIQRRFVWTDEHVLKRGLRIEAIAQPHENRWQPASQTHLIPRLYCHARALMNDGRTRTVWYLVEGGMGFAGIRDNVEFCVAGLDPWKVYGAHCRSLR